MNRLARLAGPVLGCALGCVLAAVPATAGWEWRKGDASVKLTGQVRQLGVLTRGTDREEFAVLAAASPIQCGVSAVFADCPAFDAVGEKGVGQGLTRLRLRLDLRATDWLSAVVVYDHEVLFGELATLDRDIGAAFARESLWDLQWNLYDGQYANWDHLFYRLFVKFEYEKLEAIVGRQRIPWGVGRLWNPIDRFNPIAPLAIEPDQSLGADAALGRWWFTGFDYLEAVYAPNGRSDDAAYGARFHGVFREADYEIIAGVFDEALTLGSTVSANIGGAAVRSEVVWTNPTRSVWPVGEPGPSRLDDYWQVVASIDYNVDIGRGLYLLAEYFYNGNALGFGRGKAGTLLPFFESRPGPVPGVPVAGPASSDIFGGSPVVTLAPHQTGFLAGYDVTPILRAEMLLLYDWNGKSAALAPTLRYAPTGSFEVTVGYQAFLGRDLSQYGSAENIAYALLEYFF